MPAAPPTATNAAPSAEASDGGTVRVNVGVLDRLMNLIGELVLARNQLVQTVKQPGDAGATLQRLSHVTSELQEQVMKTRMQPVARVFERLPRMVRDLSATTKKQVSVHIDANTTEIDRALVEAIRDPVMHIIRNSIDHGIETPAEREAIGKPAVGRINVRAAHEGGMVLIEIRDDGRGIDPRKVRDVAIRRGVVHKRPRDSPIAMPRPSCFSPGSQRPQR